MMQDVAEQNIARGVFIAMQSSAHTHTHTHKSFGWNLEGEIEIMGWRYYIYLGRIIDIYHEEDMESFA